ILFASSCGLQHLYPCDFAEEIMIFITTPTGTVGSALINALKSSNTPFRAGYRSADKAAEAKSISPNTALFDYQRPDTYSAALKGVEKVFLLSPPGLNEKEA